MEATGDSPPAGPPHDGLFLVLPHLALFELLAMSEVCVSLREAVMGDVLPWLNMLVEKPLNLRLSDEILLKLTCKADGRLRTLALINCVNVTDNGLQRVVETNSSINKLYIPACTGLTPEGIIRAVETLSENENSCLERLRIHGIPNMKKEHLIELNTSLRMNPNTHHHHNQRVVFDPNYGSLTLRHQDHKRTIDAETCPKCSEVRLVFSCPRKACLPGESCRGCTFCIPRCVECSGCVEPEEMEEAVSACSDDLCLHCWFQLPKCSFCNKPYCRLHADQWCTSPHSSGLICHTCYERFVHNPSFDTE